VHKESGGDSNAAMLQVWGWAQVAEAGACVCVRGRRREPRAHGCGQTGANLKAFMGRSCVGAALCTRNRVAIQMPPCYRCGRGHKYRGQVRVCV
jgi:hypothetical protein